MGMAVFPEWVQAQKMVSELAERLGSTLNEASARSILALKLEGPTPERRQELADKANDGMLTPEAGDSPGRCGEHLCPVARLASRAPIQGAPLPQAI